jgi:phosphoglycolate phosphatase-like HAD superfamily hydrolase
MIRRLQSCLLLVVLSAEVQAQSIGPLPSWNDRPARNAIVDFVTKVTASGSPTFVPPEERIAVFDNDGTLWTEHPVYTQLAFALAEVHRLAPQHPEWKANPALNAALKNDLPALAASGEKGAFAILAATHANMTVDQFHDNVVAWLATAKHPRFNRPYTECVYQPMLDVLAYLRANGFKTFIVSGGGVEFMRPWTEKTYGIPPEQVVGSSGKTQFKLSANGPELLKLPDVEFVDDGPGKPVGINRFIGRRPIAAFGNSDGDQQMLEWTAANPKTHLAVLIHHTDAVREYAYDRRTAFGKLDKALDEAQAKGWVVVSMKDDWKTVFPR